MNILLATRDISTLHRLMQCSGYVVHNKAIILKSVKSYADLVVELDRTFWDLIIIDISTIPIIQSSKLMYARSSKLLLISNDVESIIPLLHLAYAYLIKPVTKQQLLLICKGIAIDNSNVMWVSYGNKKTRIILNSIKYLEVRNYYVLIIGVQETYKVRGTLKAFEERLRDNGFMRIHQSYIVNLDYLNSVNGSSIKLLSGETLPVSRKYKSAFDKVVKNMLIATAKEATVC